MDTIVPKKKRKIIDTDTKRKKPKHFKSIKNKITISSTVSRISNAEDIFFSQVLARKDCAKHEIHKSIEKATEVMKDSNLEIQKCPFCKKFTATYQMMQRRSGDEGSTAEFKCTDDICGRSWRGRS